MAYGLGRHGINKFGASQEFAAVLPGVSTATAGPNPYKGAGGLISSYATLIASSTIEGESGTVVFFANTIMNSSGSLTMEPQGKFSLTSDFVCSGDIAWKGQQAASTNWVVQRKHPNG